MEFSEETHNNLPKKRPLSPHLTIYKPQISSILSIGHRLSGIGLFVTLSALIWWFILWVFNKFDPDYLDIFESNIVIGILVLVSYAFFYHLCTGIRHLFWDIGKGFSICCVHYTGWIAIIMSILLTAVFWLYVGVF
ncbi:MAG: succinate dehydrogenase, cytochrome b556 subunit [Rickettsiaceae bacterium]|nr:succinate dehydrogenase, cytochrome b556 subunit [Rickettsiaceae bacterium]